MTLSMTQGTSEGSSGATADLVGRYRSVRERTESLAEPLSAEDQTVQSMPDVSPTKWHRAHTTWFFETFVVEPLVSAYDTFHPQYRFLFNSYYEAVGPRHPRPARGHLSRPGVEEITQYRRYVDRAMQGLLKEGIEEADASVVELGLHHEQQHQELLLMDIKHVLSVNPLRPAYRMPPDRQEAATGPAVWLEHPGGLVDIGHDGQGFAFDNESPRHSVHLEPFALADRPVTCGEWLAFLADGGYERPELWLSEGSTMVQELGWQAPLYWFREDDSWQLFTLFGPRQLDPAEPVCHISYFEADAFARWASARLPTEAEWEAVAASSSSTSLEEAPSVADLLHPQPAGGDRAATMKTGEVWEWTSSAYLPYPRFAPAAGAVGEYNGKFMVNQHVLRGGCCATPPGHARVTYRNFFAPGSRWAFSGLRLARDL